MVEPGPVENVVNKDLLVPQGLTGPIGPRGENGRDGVGIPQKLSIAGNVVTLSDGGGSITLPTAAAASSGTPGQVSQYEIPRHWYAEWKGNRPVGTTYGYCCNEWRSEMD